MVVVVAPCCMLSRARALGEGGLMWRPVACPSRCSLVLLRIIMSCARLFVACVRQAPAVPSARLHPCAQVPHLSGRAASTRTTRTRGLSASARLLMSGARLRVPVNGCKCLHSTLHRRAHACPPPPHTRAGIADKLASLAGQPPMYVKLAGSPGEVAFMALSPTELQAYYAKHPAHKQVRAWSAAHACRAAQFACGFCEPRCGPIHPGKGPRTRIGYAV